MAADKPRVCRGPQTGSGVLHLPIRAACPADPDVASLQDGRRLRKGLSHMKPSAFGVDGWSLADLQCLSDRLLSWPADLLRGWSTLACDRRPAEGYTALIPKEGPPGPLNTRGLTILS